MTDHTALILLALVMTVVVAALVGVAAAFLARRENATHAAALVRGATAFGAILMLSAAVATAVKSLTG